MVNGAGLRKETEEKAQRLRIGCSTQYTKAGHLKTTKNENWKRKVVDNENIFFTSRRWNKICSMFRS